MDSERKIAVEFKWVFIVESWDILLGKENKINFVDRHDGTDGQGLTAEIGND